MLVSKLVIDSNRLQQRSVQLVTLLLFSSEPLTSTRSPSFSSLLVFFWESGSDRFDADSVDIWLSAAIVFMPLT